MSASGIGGPREAEIDRALARAVVASYLAGALGPEPARRPEPAAPDDDLQALEAAAAVLDGDGDGRLADSVAALGGGPAPEPGARRRLFGHTLRGTVCPYETEYGRRELIQQAHELADLAGFYRAFGLRVSERHRERPDHIACELEFLQFLSRKEALALDSGDGEMLEVTREATGRFLGEHLGRFGRAFAVGLQKADPGGAYGRVGALCEGLLAVECERFEVPLGPAMLELRRTRDDEVPMACGSSDDLVQIGAPGDPGP